LSVTGFNAKAIRRLSLSCTLTGLLLAALWDTAAAVEVAAEPAVILQDVQEVVAADAELPENLEPYLAQYRPVVKAELSFANRVCKFTEEQRTAVISDAKTWLTEYAKEQAKGQPAQNLAMWMQGGRQGGQDANPRRSLEDGVAKAVKKHITDEQKATYEKEFKKRRDFHTGAIAENFVAILDEKLYLSPEQRKELTADFQENWDESWGLELQHFTYMGNYLPNMPADRVLKHLNREQTACWNGIQKVSYGRDLTQEHQWVGGQPIDDIDLGDEPQQQPQPAVLQFRAVN
jgi:hypothetical protein